MPIGPRFRSDQQNAFAAVVGIRTIAETIIKTGAAGELMTVYDAATETRHPVFIRVKNLHATEPLFVSEDLRDGNMVPVCSAVAFTDVLACGTATDDGNGAADEWQKNRAGCISIFGTNAWRAVIIKRYADET